MTLPLAALLQGAAATPPVGEGAAGAVDLDGTNDYFSRASDFTGNADGKTFTFSAWVWGAQTTKYLYYSPAHVDIYFSNANLTIYLRNAATTVIGNISATGVFVDNTWNHIVISIDMANTSNRFIYINDVATTPTYTTYTNDTIAFSASSHSVAGAGSGTGFAGRLSNVFLDYTYRDLSNSTNRRLFITADRKPAAKAGLVALSPIIYLPMDDPTTAHVNLGTGGNMTLNGVIARSGRGANQFNAPYSDLDGAADYLSRTTALSGVADGKQVTFACSFSVDTLASNHMLLWFGTAATLQFRVTVDSSGYLYLYGRETEGGVNILAASTSSPAFVVGRNYCVVFSLDMSDTAKRFIYINGSAATVTWSTYTNANINFDIATTPRYRVGADGTPAGYHNGRLGNVFFHTSYIDISVPANLAKFVTGTGIDAKPVDLGANGELPFGTAPLIYLPMYGNNAGKNYGTGGDFTVNSGPYPGARGPNEFWGNKADFDGSTGYLARTSALTGVSDGKTFSCSFFVKPTTASGQYEVYCLSNIATSSQAYIYLDNGKVHAYVYAAGTGVILNLTGSTTMAAGSTYSVSMCIDLANTSNRSLYVNGVAETVTYSTYSNVTIPYTACIRNSIGVMWSGAAFSDYLSGDTLSEFYFTTEYIDFSQEANRLKFRDAFGSPVALLPQIEAGAIPAPAIYLRFDPADQGRNDGTGGNFTKSGTITDGGQL